MVPFRGQIAIGGAAGNCGIQIGAERTFRTAIDIPGQGPVLNWRQVMTSTLPNHIHPWKAANV
jgi:hypothetical protein